MLATVGNRFNWWASNVASITNNAAIGTAISSAGSANTVGTTVELLSAATVAEDVYGILLCFNNGSTSATVKSFLANLVTDPAGGTSWSTVIPNLIANGPGLPTSTTTGSQHPGVWYYFPLFIPAGSSIGCNVQCAAASASINCWITVYGKPSRPDLLRVGTYVDAFGDTPATSLGTAITPGTTGAEGSYVKLGSDTAKNYWWWQFGYAANDTTQAMVSILADIARGDATTKDLIAENLLVMGNVNEISSVINPMRPDLYCEVPSGIGIYGRMSGASAPDTASQMIVYGLGG